MKMVNLALKGKARGKNVAVNAVMRKFLCNNFKTGKIEN
jgi:hypothetical protein